jgi:diguanylate cyclase (GGDEF)-like protein
MTAMRRKNAVVVLFALALLTGAVLLLLGPLHGRGAAVTGVPLPWWALAALFALTELVVLSVQLRRESLSISFAEVPLVLGLAFCDPLTFVAASVAGSTVGLLYHRQRGLKLFFNLGLFVFEAALAQWLYAALLGDAHPADPRGFVAALLTMAVTQLISAVAVSGILFVMVGEFDPGVIREAMSWALVVAVAVASVGLLVVLLLTTRPSALVLLLVVMAAFVLAYRGFSRLSRGHARLESLYRFTDRLGGAVRTEDVVAAVLREARDVMTVEAAELHLLATEVGPAVAHTLGAEDGVVSGPPPERPWWRAALDGRSVLRRRGAHAEDGLRDGLAVPLRVGDDVVGALVVRDRPHHLDTFNDADVRLFGSLANHAGLSLRKAELVDRLASEAALQEHRSLHDPVTGLPNRRRLLQVLEAALAEDGDVAVVVLDLDGFGDVNEAFGHRIGDALLAEVGTRLARQVSGDDAARLGNDEFAVLLRGVRTDSAAEARAQELIATVATSCRVDGLDVLVRATAGLARPSSSLEGAEALLQHADTALYAAKQSRRGLERYAPAADGAAARLLMTGHLRDSIDRGALDVHFQPKVEAATGRPVGAEALVRWHHPAHGQVSPDAFVPLAEHTGLIRPLTTLVMTAALRACAGWRLEGWDLGVSVNLSARSLSDADLPAVVAAALEATGVPPEGLTLEITETAVMADLERSLAVLEQLHALGVHLSVDDFGTGQSSLAYLQRLPIDEMKIDKSFVLHLADEREDSAITRAAVDLGHALGLRVVAEGVEDGVAHAMLAGWGCDLVQGFAIGRPMPDEDLRRWLARFPRVAVVADVIGA